MFGFVCLAFMCPGANLTGIIIPPISRPKRKPLDTNRQRCVDRSEYNFNDSNFTFVHHFARFRFCTFIVYTYIYIHVYRIYYISPCRRHYYTPQVGIIIKRNGYARTMVLGIRRGGILFRCASTRC